MNLEGARVHMVGIGGAGMSSIAKVLLEMGVRVSGSDLRESEAVRKLRELGAEISIGHRPENVQGADLVVVSTAITPENPEVVAAQAAGLPVWHRSEMLARIFNERYGIAVSGAHGKTTITSMVAVTLERAGKDPTVIIGGELKDTGWGARYGRGPYAVAEADESDRSFLRYRPHIAIVTNIEPDHLEYYDGLFAKVVATFEEFLGNLVPGGLAVLCTDDPTVRALRERISARAVTYGLQEPADLTAREIRLREGGSSFVVVWKGEGLGRLELVIPGRHNVQNALAAVAVALETGVALEDVASALATFHGARRRFQYMGEVGGVLVVDDYAHHPTEINTTLQAARDSWRRRIVAVFQPHRYTRTHFLMEEFAGAFGAADEVIIGRIYSPPPDRPIPGVTSERLAELIRERVRCPVHHIPDNEEIVAYLVETVRPGDLVITMGAGDIWTVARDLTAELQKRQVRSAAP